MNGLTLFCKAVEIKAALSVLVLGNADELLFS